MRATLHLYNATQGWQQLRDLWPAIKPYLLAGHRLEIEVRPARRSTEQNALLHVLLTELSEQKEWVGKKRDVETWKRLVVSSWLRARGDSVEVLPALDGHGIDIVYAPTSQMSVAQVTELVEFLIAYMVGEGLEVRIPEAA